MVEEIDYDNECTCDLIDWEPNEDGLSICPFCEDGGGCWEEEDEDGG